MYEFYLTIAGAAQGPFTGETEDERHRGKLIGLAFDLPVTAAGRPAGARPSPRRAASAIGPVRFTRQWGPASPQFLAALDANEALATAIFEFERATDEGERQVFQRITLFGARVVEVRAFVDLDAEPSALMPLPPLEEISLACAGLRVENLLAGTAAEIGVVPAARPARGGGRRPAKAAKPARARGRKR